MHIGAINNSSSFSAQIIPRDNSSVAITGDKILFTQITGQFNARQPTNLILKGPVDHYVF